eukprot:SAG22_NODE_477_length_9978_cov_2.807268_9_plen_205_part_00
MLPPSFYLRQCLSLRSFAAQMAQANRGMGLRGATVTHFDQSAASVARARQRVEHFGLSKFVNFVVGDLRDVDVLTGFERFDIINCVGVLHHIPEPLPVLRKLASALRDDGGMLIMVYGVSVARSSFRLSSSAAFDFPCQIGANMLAVARTQGSTDGTASARWRTRSTYWHPAISPGRMPRPYSRSGWTPAARCCASSRPSTGCG